MNTRIILTLLCVFTCYYAFSAKRYWIGSGANTNWNSTGNWSATSGGGGGSSVPGTSDTAYFDGNGLGKCIMNATVSVRRFEIKSGYNQDTIFQNKKSITVTNKFWIEDGIFWGDSNGIAITNYLLIDGGTFRSTQSTMTTYTGITKNGGTFSHNNGKVKCSNNTSLFTGSITLFDFEIYSVNNITYTISSGTVLTVENDYTLSGTGYNNVAGGSIEIKGDCYMNNSNGTLGGSTAIKFVGTGSQHLYGRTAGAGGGVLSNVQINKSSDTLFLHDRIPVIGYWTYTAGVLSAGTSQVQCYGTGPAFLITGNHSLYNLLITGGIFQFTSSTITLNGTLTIGSGSVYMQYGAINLKGNLNIRATQGGSCCSNTHTLTINGTGDQTISGDTTGSWTNRIPSIVINKSSGTLYLIGTIYPEGWAYTSGTINAGTSTVYFPLSETISGSHTLNNVSFGTLSTNPNTTTITSGTTITANGNLTLNGTGQLTINTGTLHVKGNVTITNSSTSTSGGGSANFYLNGTGNQKITGTSTLGQGSLPNTFIDKSSGTLTLAARITHRSDWTYTTGTVNADTSTVGFYGTKNLDGQGTSTTMSFNKVEMNSTPRTLTGNLLITSNLKINASSTLASNGNNITLGGDWTNSGTFTVSNGFVTLDGTGTQTVSRPGSTETFRKLKLNKSNTSGVTFSSPVIVTDTLDLTEGIITTTSSNYLKINDNGYARKGSDSGYVTGPMRKVGNEAFTFPLGGLYSPGGGLPSVKYYHPFTITAPGSASDEFIAEYFVANPQTAYGSAKVDSLETLSDCEYWLLTRNVGSFSPLVTLGWNANMCLTNSMSDLRVAVWTGSTWADYGNSALTISGTGTRGTLKSASSVNLSSAPIIISKGKSLAYSLLKQKLDGGYYIAVSSQLRFKFDEDYDDSDKLLQFNIINTQTNAVVASDAHLSNPFKAVAYGDNRYGINLALINGGLSAGLYILEVVNEKSEKRYLRFKL